jgi:hypothetical protein
MSEHPLLDDTLAILDDLIAFPSVALTPNVDLIAWVVDRLDGVASDIRLSHDPTGTKANLARILMHGKLGGTGRLVILPVDQGFEHVLDLIAEASEGLLEHIRERLV